MEIIQNRGLARLAKALENGNSSLLELEPVDTRKLAEAEPVLNDVDQVRAALADATPEQQAALERLADKLEGATP